MGRAGFLCLLFLLLAGCDVQFGIDVVVHDRRSTPLPQARVSVRYEREGAERTSCSTGPTGQCEASTITGGGHFVVVVTRDGFRPAVLEIPRSTESGLDVTVLPPSQPRRAGSREARSVRNFPQ
jgi:hypothetical protein